MTTSKNVTIAYNGDGTATITAPVAQAKKAHAGILKRVETVIADN